MNLNKNKYIAMGMVFLVLAIVLNRTCNSGGLAVDLLVGVLYGISIGVMLLGIIKNRK